MLIFLSFPNYLLYLNVIAEFSKICEFHSLFSHFQCCQNLLGSASQAALKISPMCTGDSHVTQENVSSSASANQYRSCDPNGPFPQATLFLSWFLPYLVTPFEQNFHYCTELKHRFWSKNLTLKYIVYHL